MNRRGRPGRQQTTQHEAEAHRMHREGKTQQQIAVAIGISQPGVSKALRRVARRSLETIATEAERIKFRQTGQLARFAAVALRTGHIAEAQQALDDLRSLWPATNDDPATTTAN